MIYEHSIPKKTYTNHTEKMALLEGEIKEEESKELLAGFLRENLGFTYKLISGIDLHPEQEIVLKHMFLRDKGTIVAGRGVGKSQYYKNTSVVSTNTDKLISLPDLIPNLEFKDEEYILDIPPVKLWNGQSYQETSKILVQKGKDCMKVKTKMGYYVEGSTNHKIKVFDKKVGDVVWKRYHALDPKNDLICISKNNIPEDVTPQQNELLEAYTHGCNFNDLTRIPQYILRNKYLIIQFLIGAFKNNYINTQNELLAQQIHLCLLTLGKVSKLYREDGSFIIEYNKDKILLTEEVDTSFFFDPIDSIETFSGDCIDFMDIPDGACYWGNGFINHNSFMISVFCTLYPLFHPNCKICIISANFRGARRILEEAQKILQRPDAELLRQCFPDEMRRSNDAWRWQIKANGSMVSALPLGNSDGLRGERASVVLVDEGLLINEHIQKYIIGPFLTAKQNYADQKKIIDEENYLISTGKLDKKDRTVFAPNKYFVLSSASFEFEYMYELFKEYIDQTTKELEIDPETPYTRPAEYFVMRLAYDSLNKHSHMDSSIIDSARAEGGEESDYFRREYRAMFIDASQSYFNAKKMAECTFEDGDTPCVRVFGDKKKKYLLSMDPSYSSSADSDFFAMGVYEIDEESESICLVHSYAKAGGELKEHHQYLAYILEEFNIVFLVVDVQGPEFIKGFNESSLAKDKGFYLNYLNVKLAKMSEDDYRHEIKEAKRQYEPHTQTIVYGQTFTSESIRQMNEHLQNSINMKRVWFASRLYNHEHQFKVVTQNFKLPFAFKDNEGKVLKEDEFIALQDDLIKLTKDQTVQIEVKVTPKGTQTFDLPSVAKRSKSKKRPRKDNYTTLLLANWGYKLYKDITAVEERKNAIFTPFILG